jgi:hypothetical protein
MDLAASGSLLDSIKASSPRHAKFAAAAADQEDWMVCRHATIRGSVLVTLSFSSN